MDETKRTTSSCGLWSPRNPPITEKMDYAERGVFRLLWTTATAFCQSKIYISFADNGVTTTAVCQSKIHHTSALPTMG
jgi:hypothetical protein